MARLLSFGEYAIDDVASTKLERDHKYVTDIVIEPDVAAPLRAGGPEAGWINDPDNGTFVPVPPEAAAPLTASRQSTDDGSRTYVPEVANTLTRERTRSAAGDGTQSTLVPEEVIPFDTTQLTNPNNGSNPQPGDPCHAIAAQGHPPAVAFKPSHYTREKDGEPSEVAFPLTADTDKGDQDTVLLVHEPMSVDSGQVPVNAEGVVGSLRAGRSQAQAICIHSDAIGRDGKAKTDSPDAEGVMRKRDAGMGISEDAAFNLTTGAPHAVAFQERGRPGGRNVESQEDVAYALTAPAAGGRRNEMNIAAPEEPFVFQTRIARNDRGQPEEVVPALNGVNAGETSDMRPVVAQPMIDSWRVRRLTPVECERLQGIPDHFTHIELKKRQRTKVPADLEAYWRSHQPDLTHEQMLYLCADTPRYRVLGNSYARNFIRWVAHGIAIVDKAIG